MHGENLPVLDLSCYLWIEFSSEGLRDKHINSLEVRNLKIRRFVPNFT